MARVRLSAADTARADKIAAELDTSFEEFLADARPELSDKQWDLLADYAHLCVRRALVVGSLLHAIVDSEGDAAFPYRGRGREVFVRDAIAAWRDSFAPMPDAWKLVAIFERVPGGEQRVMADVATLEVMAANRMFASLDDQCAEVLASEA